MCQRAWKSLPRINGVMSRVYPNLLLILKGLTPLTLSKHFDVCRSWAECIKDFTKSKWSDASSLPMIWYWSLRRYLTYPEQKLWCMPVLCRCASKILCRISGLTSANLPVAYLLFRERYSGLPLVNSSMHVSPEPTCVKEPTQGKRSDTPVCPQPRARSWRYYPDYLE